MGCRFSRILRTGSCKQDRIHRKRGTVQSDAAQSDSGSHFADRIHYNCNFDVQRSRSAVESFRRILLPHNGSIFRCLEIILQKRKEKFGKQAIGNTYRCGTKHSAAVCKKISENRKGKTLGHAVSEDTKIKIGNANRGRSCRHAPEVYKQVGKFTAHRMDVLKQKFSPSQTDWNTFQKKVKTIKEQIILEMSESKKLPKKIIRQNYKEDILSELLSRL